LIQWAVNSLGEAQDVTDVTPASPIDARMTYVAPSGTQRAGTDTSGNPLFKLLDEGGDWIQYAVNAAGEAIGITNLSENERRNAVVAPPPTRTPPAGGNSLLNTGGGATDILTEILTGDGANKSGGVLNIVNQTDNRPVTTTNIDNSNRSVVSYSSVVNTSVNSADLVSNVVDSIARIFKGGNAPVQASKSVVASNDTLFGSPLTPASRQAGMSLDGARMSSGSNGTPITPTATVSGEFSRLTQNITNDKNSILLWAGLVVGLFGLFFALRRRG
jgi:hypothetical protein